jgi:antitoxin (DNA-binding transcriptional repressor) of toxin-antitoxin stability system
LGRNTKAGLNEQDVREHLQRSQRDEETGQYFIDFSERLLPDLRSFSTGTGGSSRWRQIAQEPYRRRRIDAGVCDNVAMRKVSVSDLLARTSAIVDEASEGIVVVIEKHGTPVAEMRPVKRVAPSEAARKLKTLWDSLPQGKGDSGKFLEEDR